MKLTEEYLRQLQSSVMWATFNDSPITLAPQTVGDLLADLEEAILQEDEMSANAGYLSEERQNLLAENADLRQQLVEAERKIALCIKSREDEIAEREAELAVTRQQLAEAQARLGQILHVADKMRCSGGSQEFQHWFDELKLFLLRKQETSALQSTIEQAVAPYKQALQAISSIPNRDNCGDWDEIEEARAIANTALSAKETSNDKV